MGSGTRIGSANAQHPWSTNSIPLCFSESVSGRGDTRFNQALLFDDHCSGIDKSSFCVLGRFETVSATFILGLFVIGSNGPIHGIK